MDDGRLIDRMEDARSAWRVPSLVAALLHDGRVAWTGGVGSVDGRDGPPPTATTQYRIGSITKSLTAVLVLQSRDAGALSLHDRVDDHLDVGPALGRVRLGDLLGHVGGVRAETSPPWWERSPGRTWERLRQDFADAAAVPAPPGVLHYSNPGYAVLGRVLEVVEGRPWASLLTTRLRDPLGLGRTTTRALDHDHAVALAVHPDRGGLLVEPVHDYLAMAPAGQLWSTARDLGRWAEVLLEDGGDVVPAAMVDEMARPRAVTTMDPPSAFGSGLQVVHQRGRDLVGHGGSVPGFVATVFVDRASGSGVVVMGNSTAGFGTDLALDLLDLVEPDGADEADTPGRTTTTPGDVQELVGTWYWGPRAVAVTVDDDGAPVVDVGLAPRMSRFARRDGDWVGRDGYFTGEVLEVVRRPDGGVVCLELASMALTPEPYGPPDAVPGGVGDGWRTIDDT